MTALRIIPGEVVVAGKNDAQVEPGSRGRYLRRMEETGALLVEVDGRGRVALLPDQLTTLDGLPVTLPNGHAAPVREAVEVARTDKRGWSEERRERYRATIAAKRKAEAAEAAEEETMPITPSPSSPSAHSRIRRELYLDAADTVAELGVAHTTLRAMAQALGVGRCPKTGTCRYTAKEIVRLKHLQQVQQELGGVTPAMAMKVLSLAKQMAQGEKMEV